MICPDERPVVSVVVPTFNEEAHIAGLLESVCRQDLRESYEVLVVDGCSTDATRPVVEEWAGRDRRVRLIDNLDRSTPVALNVGLAAARGEYIAILGAHCRYPRNYLSSLLRVVRDSPSPTGCGGVVRVVAAGVGVSATLAAAVQASSFASSSHSFRTQSAGAVDSIPYPLYRMSDVLAIGGFDERLDRNQDNDLSHRLRRAGVRLVLTDVVTCDYVARPGLASLCRYAFRTGRWNGLTVRGGYRVMQLRHFVPGIFVFALGACGFIGLSSSLLGRVARSGGVAAVILHQVAASLDARRMRLGSCGVLLPPAVLAFHLSYGAGTVWGLSGLSRRPRVVDLASREARASSSRRRAREPSLEDEIGELVD
jgi:glycosyltransferase involved in cell wall biosynthesis